MGRGLLLNVDGSWQMTTRASVTICYENGRRQRE